MLDLQTDMRFVLRQSGHMELTKVHHIIDQIQNGLPSAIIHLDRPDIAEYHENRSR